MKYASFQHWNGPTCERTGVTLGDILEDVHANVPECADDPFDAKGSMTLRWTHTRDRSFLTCDEVPGRVWVVLPSVGSRDSDE